MIFKTILRVVVVIIAFPIVFAFASFDKTDLVYHAWRDATKGNISALLFIISCASALFLWFYFISLFFCG